MTARCCLAAALVLAIAQRPVQAQTQAQTSVYYHAGVWDAFSGPGDGGVPVCGVGTTSQIDGRSLSLRLPVNAGNVTFQAKRSTWNIPDGTAIQVVMQVGLDAPWTLQATGSGQIVTWAVDRNAMQAFDAQFRLASSMTLSFPTGNEPPWQIALAGSSAISNAWSRCMADLAQRAAMQPAAQAPTGPTQPFGQPAAQPTQPFGQPANPPPPAQPEAGSPPPPTQSGSPPPPLAQPGSPPTTQP